MRTYFKGVTELVKRKSGLNGSEMSTLTGSWTVFFHIIKRSDISSVASALTLYFYRASTLEFLSVLHIDDHK